MKILETGLTDAGTIRPLRNGNDNGNILFLILIAVALFAALSYAVTQTTTSGGGTGKEESHDLKASQLLNYTVSISAAVQRMIMSGISPNDIQFYTSFQSGDPCTTGTNCVFAANGGGAIFIPPSQMFNVPIFQNKFFFYSAGDGGFIDGIGDTLNDEVMIVAQTIPIEICAAINKRLGLPDPDTLPFNRNYDVTIPPFTLDSISGNAFGCFRDSAAYADEYGFYHVFMER